LPAKRVDGDVCCVALDPAVPGPVEALAVFALFAVGVVVLVVVRDEVAQGETVVGDHEVDRGDRASGRMRIEIAGSGEARSELAQRGSLTAPEVAHGVAELAVPLGPQRREVADLVSAVAEVPGLGDELDLRDHRVLLDDVEEGRKPVHLMELAGQGCRQVEAEPVDVHLDDPVAQRVHDQLQDVGVAHQQAVAGARRVVVLRLVVVDQTVVGGVVDAAEGDGRAVLVALCGVVVDHVEDHLDVGFVQRLHHRLELGDLLSARPGCGIGRMWSQEADGVVAPVVCLPLGLQRRVLDELVHRHQLDGSHA